MTNPVHSGFHVHAPSPLGKAQQHTRAVANGNMRTMLITLGGIVVVVALACLALWYAAHPH